MQSAFAAGSRVVGPCHQVAKDVAKGFEFLGQKPQFVALRAKAYDFMSCDLPDGTSLPVIRNGYHVVARGGNRIYDAFTGPAGMTVADYMARLQARYDFDWSVVATP